MNWMKNQSRQENLMYLVVWGLLFAVPLLSFYVRTVSDQNHIFDWREVMIVWRSFVIFLLLFLLHNFLLAPLIVYQRRRKLYFSIVAVILAAFSFYQFTTRHDRMGRREHRPFRMEQHEERPPQFEGHAPEFDSPRPPERRPGMPPVVFAEHDIMALMVLILMFGANLGIKYYYRSRHDQKKLVELEKQNLEQQLEYLRYQINPHFFMNTLNNIHALVDIDPSKAQETILELSKMMRFVLYEGNKQRVPLSKEMGFINTYVNLMQLRYTDKVHIALKLPAEVPDKTIPPLVLISFVENAFKHGVSYQRESFIETEVNIKDEKLHFTCINSKADKPNEEKGGVGLANVRKRLDLLYDHSYTLNIQDCPDKYIVELILPLS